MKTFEVRIGMNECRLWTYKVQADTGEEAENIARKWARDGELPDDDMFIEMEGPLDSDWYEVDTEDPGEEFYREQQVAAYEQMKAEEEE